MIAEAAGQGAFVAPEVEWAALAPLLVVLGAGVVGVLVEAFAPAGRRRGVQVVLALVAVAAAFGVIVWQGLEWFGADGPGVVLVLGGALTIDGPGLLFQAIIIVAAFVALLVVADRTATRQDAFAPTAAAVPGSEYEDLARRKGLEQTEVYPLLLFAIGGMLIFPVAGDLVTMFIALEVLSLPLYVLSGMARRRRLLSQEASFKYFVLGSFASALFLFGTALLYGYSGTVTLDGIARVGEQVFNGTVPDGWELLWLVGMLMVLSGLLFKVGAVPFQAWTPDVYQGAPTPITGFMAACTKIAAFGALLRILYSGAFLGTVEMVEAVEAALWVVAIATMVVGTVVGATQTDIKRMLGYSSVAHAGFILVGVLGFNPAGRDAVLFYLLVYGLTTVGAFAVVTLVREVGPGGEVLGEATHLGQWAGLGRRRPWLAGAFALFLLSFAGIPLTGGFIAKFSVFGAAVRGNDVLGDATVLAVVGVLASAVAVFFYIRVIVIMFFTSPQAGGAGTATSGDKVTGADASDTDTLAGPAAADDDALSGASGDAARSSVLVASGTRAVTVVASEGYTALVVGVTAAAVLALGVFPSPVLDLIARVTGLG